MTAKQINHLLHPKYNKRKNSNYLFFTRMEDCLVCKSLNTEAHHVWCSGGRSGNDFLAVPLCCFHHREYHDKGHDTFEDKNNLDLSTEIIKLLIKYIVLKEKK